MTPRPGECLTCGFPDLRSQGHAEWCASWEAMPQADKHAATMAMAEATGLVNIDNGERYRATLRAARKRLGLT